jgi:RNA polymerase sigma factor (TIGR02999 family)
VTPDLGQVMERLRAGDRATLDGLVTLLYDELRRIAARHLHAERSTHTLQTTALVHEVYLKLAGDSGRNFTDRAHFLAVASRVMRQVLVDYARARSAQKRSGGARAALEWTGEVQVESGNGLDRIDLLNLDAALDALAGEDRGLAGLVEMHYFGGMTAEEAADVLGQSVHVVRHDLRLAQAWLRRKLGAPAK